MKIFKTIKRLVILGALGGIGYFFYQGGTFSDITDMISKDANLSDDAVNDLYKASRADLIKGYEKGENAIANDYAKWQAGSTRPANPGVHSGRYMMTYVNDIGHNIYTQYLNQNVDLPVGTKIAKESFTVKGKGKFSPSPLFIMEKVGLDAAPETDGWFYARVNRNGRKMITSQKFCHECHMAFKQQDFMAYPEPKARFGYNAAKAKADAEVAAADLAAGNVANGQKVFATCASCHMIGPDAKNAFGPVLSGIVGRDAGSYPGYNYSASLKAAKDKGLVWNEETLFEWLNNPSEFLQTYLGDSSARSNMPLNFADPKVRKDVIAFLESEMTRQ